MILISNEQRWRMLVLLSNFKSEKDKGTDKALAIALLTVVLKNGWEYSERRVPGLAEVEDAIIDREKRGQKPPTGNEQAKIQEARMAEEHALDLSSTHAATLLSVVEEQIGIGLEGRDRSPLILLAEACRSVVEGEKAAKSAAAIKAAKGDG
jgi:hypothetical protein